MKVSLLFSSPSTQYEVPWSSEMINHPLQSGLAVIAKTLEDSIETVDVECFGDQVVDDDSQETCEFRYRSVDEFVDLCKDSDVVGMSILLNNISKSIEIAEELKRRNPDQKIVFGGTGICDNNTAKLILQKIDAIDYVVRGDGEQPLLEIVKGNDPADIPNLFYKDGNEVVRSGSRFISDLNDRPTWDFTSAPDHANVMRAFDSRTELFNILRSEYGNFLGMVGIQLSKGCEKAEEMGRCFYCVSSQTPKVIMRDANKFWEQVMNLYDKHGITEYNIADNVIATPEKLEALLDAKKNFSIPEEIQFRGYGYVPFFYKQGGEEMMKQLQELGVKNLFLGVENFDKSVNELSNKPGFEFSEVYGILEQGSRHGVDLFLPIMAGMPGDSKESFQYNIECMEELLKEFGETEYGKGGLVRVDLSMAMPLRGTPWFNQLARNQEVLAFYKQETGTDLLEHIDPDYDVLRDASLRFHHSTGLTKKDVDEYRIQFCEMCSKYIRPEQIGGYEPTIMKGGKK